MSKEELQNNYLDFLRKEGFSGTLDDDGDIDFKFEGDKYVLFVDENDPEYFRIQAGYGCDFDSDDSVAKHMEAANAVNAEYKLGKIFIRVEKELVLLETSLFIADPNGYKPFFKRCLGILQGMISDFADKLKEE